VEHLALASGDSHVSSARPGVTYDARAVANCIIELAVEYDRPVTHLSLQKILYFLHGKHLIERGRPLVGGHFEAWQYGPVHPLIFSTFKHTRGRKLTEPAERLDPLTGSIFPIAAVENKDDKLFIRANAARFLDVSPNRLIDLSHADGSPWDVLTKRPRGLRVYGDRITNDLISKFFHRHIMPIREKPACGDPIDEQPPS
jgi:uncharacterized phage-associated protein